jgi:hypothetical protein
MLDVSLCVDCVTADANGTDDLVESQWTGFLDDWQDWVFGPILTDEQNEPNEPHFSWSPCDGCGSHLGGDRFDYVAVHKDDFDKGEQA